MYVCVCMFVCMYVYVYVSTQSLHNEQDVTQDQFLKWISTGLNSVFSVFSCHTKFKEHRLSYYLLIAGEKNIWIHTFPMDNRAM